IAELKTAGQDARSRILRVVHETVRGESVTAPSENLFSVCSGRCQKSEMRRASLKLTDDELKTSEKLLVPFYVKFGSDVNKLRKSIRQKYY
ncbi:hypothetical protein ACHAXM_000005, partial [Skeletonema potamos]